MICYKKPKWNKEIANEIWPDNPKVGRSQLSKTNGPRNKLKKLDYLKELPRKPEQTNTRQYYFSKPDYILDEINKSVIIKRNEQEQLYNILDSKEFRHMVIFEPNVYKDINTVLHIISLLATNLVFKEFVLNTRHFKSRFNRIEELEKTLDFSKLLDIELTEKEKKKNIEIGHILSENLNKLSLDTKIQLMKLNPYSLHTFHFFAGAFQLGLQSEFKK